MSISPAPRSARACRRHEAAHNFGGSPSHGVRRSATGRTARSASARTSGKVFKGKKMAGHMGSVRDHAASEVAHRRRPGADAAGSAVPARRARIGHQDAVKKATPITSSCLPCCVPPPRPRTPPRRRPPPRPGAAEAEARRRRGRAGRDRGRRGRAARRPKARPMTRPSARGEMKTDVIKLVVRVSRSREFDDATRSSCAPTSCTAAASCATSWPSAGGDACDARQVGRQLFDQEDLSPEGHRRRPPRLAQGADLPQGRHLQGPDPAQPRA